MKNDELNEILLLYTKTIIFANANVEQGEVFLPIHLKGDYHNLVVANDQFQIKTLQDKNLGNLLQ